MSDYNDYTILRRAINDLWDRKDNLEDVDEEMKLAYAAMADWHEENDNPEWANVLREYYVMGKGL